MAQQSKGSETIYNQNEINLAGGVSVWIGQQYLLCLLLWAL